jgi:carbonic anhydrase/acetyltransferase-like protein (isoleucine patch superfamily)
MVQLYNLSPLILGNVFIAPNATISGISLLILIGEVFLGNDISIWHGTVIRGDINAVMYFIGLNQDSYQCFYWK